MFSKVGTPSQAAVAQRAATDSITLVRNEALPLAANSGKHVLVTGWGAGTTTTLASTIAAKGVSTQRLYTGSAPSSALIAGAVAAAKQSDDVVVTTNNAWADPGQQSLVNALIGTGKPVIEVALAGPYDLAYTPSVRTFVAAYGYQPAHPHRADRNALRQPAARPPAGDRPDAGRQRDGRSLIGAACTTDRKTD